MPGSLRRQSLSDSNRTRGKYVISIFILIINLFKKMFIINSAAYISYEFHNDLGIFPPCLLPVANKRLIELQVKSIRQIFPNTIIYISLPKNYFINDDEVNIFKKLNVSYVLIPDKLSLGEAVSYVLDLIYCDISSENIKVLHGDTLINDLPTDDDLIAVTRHNDGYSWEYLDDSDHDSSIWAGFFAFSDLPYLKKCLAECNYNFIQAVKAYSATKKSHYREVFQWKDFGHVDTYFSSRSEITTERVFNHIVVKENICYKTSDNLRKLQAEANWFQSLPLEMKRYCPSYLGSFTEKGSFGYATEYLSLLPLSEVYVYGKNSIPFWNRIFSHIASFLSNAKSFGDNANIKKVEKEIKDLYDAKTRQRLTKFFDDRNNSELSLNSLVLQHRNYQFSIIEIVENCINAALKHKPLLGILHGDLCFSNILYDSRANVIKLIDPRGMNNIGEFTIYGDITYDLAKLTHSVIGLYDYIIAEKYKIVTDADGFSQITFAMDERLKRIQNNFIKIFFCEHSKFNTNFKEIIPITILLFLSMLPLHNDSKERQRAFLLNAVRLYRDYML